MDTSMIREYQPDILEDLKKLVAIPSVAENFAAEREYPFGEKAAEALAFVLSRAAEMGFKTRNVNNCAGYAEYIPKSCDENAGYCAVVTHLDVVPAGEGWATDPFVLTEKDGVLCGRGVADDKGPAVVALYCMKALADLGATGKRRVRCIFGCGEEVGMEDMREFFRAEPLPEFAFTPDSGYPVCNREKGILQVELSSDDSLMSDIQLFEAGSAANCVAEEATARFAAPLSGDEMEIIRKHCENSGCVCEIDGKKACVKGKSAHAMEPRKGLNAAAALLTAVNKIKGQKGSFYEFGHDCLREPDGSGLGIACADQPSGALTMNLGKGYARSAGAGSGRAALTIDVRYPVTADGEEIFKKIGKKAADYGFAAKIIAHQPPIYFPEDHPLIKTLGECYSEVTGQPFATYSTGGGTYARALAGRGVAFGMDFPGQPPANIHQANENFPIELLMKHAEICLRALELGIK